MYIYTNGRIIEQFDDLFLLPKSIKVQSVHDLTPEDEITLENILLGLDVEYQCGEMDIDKDMDENEDEDLNGEEDNNDDDVTGSWSFLGLVRVQDCLRFHRFYLILQGQWIIYNIFVPCFSAACSLVTDSL